MEDNIKEAFIKNYVVQGGELFRVTSIDMYRDGGTIGIRTSKKSENNEYYKSFINDKVYSTYAMKDEDEVNETGHLLYLTERIDAYIKLTGHTHKQAIRVSEIIKTSYGLF